MALSITDYMKSLFTFTIAFFMAVCIWGQPRVVINRILPTLDTLEGKQLIKAYTDLAAEYQFIAGGMDSTMYYAEKALEKAEEIDFLMGQQSAHYYLGAMQWRQFENYEKAMFHFEKVKELLIEEGTLEKIPSVDNAIGIMEMLMGDYDQALETLQKAFLGASEISDYTTLSNASSNMSMIYSEMDLPHEAIKVNKEALEYIAQDTTEEQILSFISTCLNLNDQYLGIDSIEQAKVLLDTLEVLLKDRTFPVEQGRLATGKMKYYDKIGNKEKTYEIAAQTIKDYQNLQGYDQKIYTTALFYYGINSAEKNEDQKAYFALKELDRILENTHIDHQEGIHEVEYDIYKTLGDYEKALFHLEKYRELSDSLINAETNEKIVQLQAKYELEKRERQIQEKENEKLILKRNNTYLLAGLLGLCLIGSLIYLLIYKKRQKEKERMNEVEQKMLSLQMNPHFIFNAISSIQNYLFDENDTKTAIRHLSTFSSLMRQILENNREKFIPLSEEISFLNNYLSLQKLRFDNKFNYQINVNPDINVDETAIPPLLTQPFVENAIEHGKIYQVKDGFLNIDIDQTKDAIQIKILDNGIGMESSKIETEKKNMSIKKKSLSLSITKERLQLLSKLMKKDFFYEISGKNEGTLINLKVPFIKA